MSWKVVVDFDLCESNAICMGVGLLGFRLMRVAQMVTRYSWINERAGILRWRRRDDAPASLRPKSG